VTTSPWNEQGRNHPTPHHPARRAGERGFTLAEMLIAVTVMAIVFVLVFTLYDNLQKTFKRSENLATQQQATRVAFDRMVADVRMAGFNSNPDGDPNRLDEQIEGMWGTAVTVRGDYDHDDASSNTSPESTLGGPTNLFKVVSTGNDEIVTYALGKPSGTGGTTLSFVADVSGVPRNGTQETVSLANVHTATTDPPYTLYRITVNPNSTSVTKQPVADDIRSVAFTYYDGAGNVLTPVGGADDPNSLAQRRRIAKVGLQVVGMTEDPDMAWIDPTEPNAPTRHYRKFTLESDVTPRNLGFVGVVDIDLDDPNNPTNFVACQGHCGGTYLKWQTGGDPDVASYTVSWGASAASLTNVISTEELHYFVDNITGPQYYAVRAVDLTGNQSNNVMVGPSTPTNTTTPAAVTGVACSGDTGGTRAAVKNIVNVAWSGIGGNTTNLGCDESPFPIRDLKGYRIYKGGTAGFDPNNSTQVLQSWDPNSVPYNTNTIADNNVVNCRPYFYKVRGEDECGTQGGVSSSADGASTTNVPPAAPSGVNALNMGLGAHQVTWNQVTQDTDGPPSTIHIDKYRVLRAAVPVGDDPNTASYTQVFAGIVSTPATPMFQDSSVPSISGSQRYWYRITAMDDCPNESAPSIPDEADKCSFGGSLSMSISPGGSQLTGAQTITLSATPGVTITNSQLIIRDASTGSVIVTQTDATSPYSYTWNASSVPPGSYEITGFMTNSSGCSDSVTTAVSTVTSLACCVAIDNPNLSPATGSLKNNELFFDIVNNCGTNVLVSAVNILFTNNTGNNAQLDQFEFNVLNSFLTRRNIDLVPNMSSPVTLDFTTAALSPPLSLTKYHVGASPARLRYAFSQALLRKVGTVFVGEDIRSRFQYTIEGQSGVASCEVDVVTNPLSVVVCDPATDINCGN
jgi:prepilin-type N-terminal cleavage/methylation domain-containing protein